ncbi:MAG: hypothetical protein P0Y65_19340 [Candidatus Devosia phytovorans]|uniref:Uncharacterized protein n=1 Tax=Candidatus Devosia phytovorans TaxID=3121372 RepID=A0AAJ5VUS2_9HYPH|nr:hypothetical protein [Devosia sp.]WEK04305.1 MAG: hypothetical protein P0Y65_19340 [Devosia sp.]
MTIPPPRDDFIAVISFAPLPGGRATRGKASGGFGGFFGHEQSVAAGQEPVRCEHRNGKGAVHHRLLKLKAGEVILQNRN